MKGDNKRIQMKLVYGLLPNMARIGKGGWIQEPPKKICENLVEIATFRQYFPPHGRHNTQIHMKLSL